MASLLVYRPGAIGDFVLALPALVALRAAFRDAPLTVVGPAAALPLARAAGVADATLAADDARLTPLFAGSAGDVAPDLRPTHAVLWAGPSAAPLAETLRMLGAARVVHVPSRPPPDARQHVADYLLASLAPLGVQARGPAVPTVRPTAAALAATTGFLAPPAPPSVGGWRGSAPAPSASPPDLGGTKGGPSPALGGTQGGPRSLAASAEGAGWLALHVGSGSPRKNWPLPHFVAVAEALAARGLRPLVVAGPAEAETAAAALRALAPLGPALARDWPLDLLVGLLARCAGYVGGDSGITHLAAAVGIPVVAVFGPTDPAVWAPRGPRVTIVRRPVPCQPCTWSEMWACAHRACLTTLAPDAVVAAVESNLPARRGSDRAPSGGKVRALLPLCLAVALLLAGRPAPLRAQDAPVPQATAAPTSAPTPAAQQTAPAAGTPAAEAPTPSAGTPSTLLAASGAVAAGTEPGRVLLQDDFADRRSGWPSRSNDPSTRRVGYEGGEYFVMKMAGSGGAPFVTRPERFADFVAQVDVRLMPPTQDAYIYLDFRRQENRDHYSLVVDPNEPAFLLRRVQAGSGANLIPWTRSPAIAAGSAWNRLGVRAQGADFVLFINGQEVGRARDAALREGVLGLGVGSLEDGPAEGRFRDLVVTNPD